MRQYTGLHETIQSYMRQYTGGYTGLNEATLSYMRAKQGYMRLYTLDYMTLHWVT